ncbi:hypothetical protein HYT33_02775 [Candidatus Roizmanbacteria bacterium]|nr:hypothetical protein [Candidatus Roizmanbacteria bacterium]
MSTPYSSFIWDNVRYLWYLQFPWRFLLFVGFFISIVGAYAVYFLRVILSEAKDLDKKRSAGFFGLRPQNDIVMILIILILISPILVYQKYFRPQQFLKTDDKARTSFDEVSWRISATSFEFAPRGVKTKKSVYDTTVFDIEKDQLRRSPYEIVFGETDVFQKVNKFGKKSFEVFAKTKTKFRLNTFHFPGWSAYLDGKEITIDDLNDYKLITVDVPPGRHLLEFLFGDTQVRKVANFLSVIAVIIVGALLFIVEKKGERVGLVPKLK